MAGRKRTDESDEVLEQDEIDEREPKTVSFFSRFKDYDSAYMITLYRKAERNKKIVLKEYENYTPSITEIQETFGGGTYNLYVNEMMNGKIGKLIDSCEIHIEGLSPVKELSGVKVPDENDFFSERNLQKLAMIKTIFGNGQGNESNNMAELMLKISENTNKMFNEMMKSQQESERRTTDLMIKMSENNKSNLSELMETWSFFNEISGNKQGESSPIDRLMEYAPAILSGMNSGQPVKPVLTQTKKIPERSEMEIIDNIISKIPDNIKNAITQENKVEYITKFHSMYKDDVTRDEVERIVNRILEIKGR